MYPAMHDPVRIAVRTRVVFFSNKTKSFKTFESEKDKYGQVIEDIIRVALIHPVLFRDRVVPIFVLKSE